MFSYLHHRLLIEEKIIEHELNQKVKEQKVEMRKRAEISTSFGTLNDPLLRMFMMFAFDCIHFLSQDENNDNQKIWKYLEQNVEMESVLKTKISMAKTRCSPFSKKN